MLSLYLSGLGLQFCHKVFGFECPICLIPISWSQFYYETHWFHLELFYEWIGYSGQCVQLVHIMKQMYCSSTLLVAAKLTIIDCQTIKHNYRLYIDIESVNNGVFRIYCQPDKIMAYLTFHK